MSRYVAMTFKAWGDIELEGPLIPPNGAVMAPPDNGWIGVLPVYDSREAATKAHPGVPVYEIESTP